MKTISILGVLLVYPILQAQTVSQATPGSSALPSPTPYAVISRDANSAIWQRQTYQAGPNGAIETNIERYTELATGLNHLLDGKWVPSSEDIGISPDGTSAAATNGQAHVFFPGDIYNGVIKLVTPDGKTLQSQPIGLSYSDGSNSVLLAVLTNATGAILPSGNQVIYKNAFAGLHADLLYTYTKAGFEQNIILREQPPDPSVLGLNSQKTRLQVMTEFFNPPAPQIASVKVSTAAGNLEDDHLRFGAMAMGRGKAFLLGTNSPSVRVEKRWLVLRGRQFLIEEVPIVSIAKAIDTLSPFFGQTGAGTKPVVAKNLILPPQRLARTTAKTPFLAQATPPDNGLVLDYQMLNGSLTNYTFQGDMTYYISGGVWLYGTTTIEGGTVIKADRYMMEIDQNGSIACKTGPYRPGVFTSVNDNSVGESINISTGSPQPYDVGQFFEIYSTNITLRGLRFSYAGLVMELPESPSWIGLTNCQFFDDDIAVSSYGDVGLYNVLISRTWPGADTGTDQAILLGNTLIAQNVTADGGSAFASSAYSSISLTNCIITGQSLVSPGGSYTLATNHTVWLQSPTVPIYQTVGGGNYYLTNGSPYRDYGTANIDPALLADLRTRTTYPPIAYTNVTFTSAQTFSPHAYPDTNIPDLGYHYDPLDYAFGGCIADSNMTFTAGTAAGWFRTSSGGGAQTGQGIYMQYYTTASFQGTEQSPDAWVRLSTVQEHDTTGGHGPAGITGGDYLQNSNTIVPAPVINLSFTRCSVLINEANHFRDGYYGALIVRANDCEFYGGGLGGYCMSCYLTNCLVDRLNSLAEDQGMEGNEYVVQNCTCHGGSVYFVPYNYPVPLIVRDSAFDGTTFTLQNYGTGTNTDYDYNAYTNGAPQLTGSGTHDVIVTNSFNWEAGPLGNYYLPTNSLLINAGDVPASQVGLYHFTTQTNMVWNGSEYQEVPEGDKSPPGNVDIGYHYVAVYANGNPLDSNGNGIPDYIEDTNGDGQPLTITLLTPANDSFFAEPATIPMQATVFDWSGTVTNVEFFNGSANLTALADAPYDYNWPIVAAGNYSVIAEAFDDKGATAYSTSASVTVTNLCGN